MKGDGGIGLPVRPHITENHRLVCGACRNDWHKADSDESWFGVCGHCGSDQLTVESEPVPGAPLTGEWELECGTCAATWTGMPDDPCAWCQRAAEIQLEHQAELLLTPPQVNRDDINYEAKIRGWGERLARGVVAELITDKQAAAAWKRTT
jgi:hypothetical protein